MLTFGIYMVGSERQGRRHEPVTTLFWAFAFASLFWALVTPWWSFPFDQLASAGDAALGLGVIVVGTLLPFTLMVSALRHIPAPRAAVVATLEPVLGAVFAWLIHDEALAAVQIAGGAVVIADLVQPATSAAQALAARAWDESVRHRSLERAGHLGPFEKFVHERWNLYADPDPDPIDQPSPLLDQLRWLEEAGLAGVDVFWMKAGHAVFGGVRER